LVLSGALSQHDARAQPRKVIKIGYLWAGFSATRQGVATSIANSLAPFGWTLDKDFVVEIRAAENKPERLDQLAQELVRLNVDIIVTDGTLAPLAAKRATQTIPIVLRTGGDPVGSGLVESLARSGNNVTGLSLMAPDLGGKRLELLKELVPAAKRAAVLWNITNPYPKLVYESTRLAGTSLKLDVLSMEARSPEEVSSLLSEIGQSQIDGLLVVEDPLTFDLRKLIADKAAERKVPVIYGTRDYVIAGGLVSYGCNLADLAYRAGGYIDKILRGAKPTDLPIQQPTKFELFVNLKTAKALGLTIPPTLLARADEVIE
jgi:putative ABC transport system substrate-binding protein